MCFKWFKPKPVKKIAFLDGDQPIEYQAALREEIKRLPLLAKFIRWRCLT